MDSVMPVFGRLMKSLHCVFKFLFKTNIKKLNTRYVGQGKEFVMALIRIIDFLA